MFTKLPFLRMCCSLLFAALLVELMVGSPITAKVQAAGLVRYVTPGGVETGTCDSWGTACSLQYALTNALSGDEIWASAGIYTPTAPGGQAATFQLKSGVALYGGFAGSETSRSERDWKAHLAVLSGDLDGNDIKDTDGVITTAANITGANAYNVVTGSNTEATAVLDGFIVTGGNAQDFGGGMYNFHGNPTVSHVTFCGNGALRDGGGMYNDTSSPLLTDVVFYGNTAGNAGGGMANYTNDYYLGHPHSDPTLINVTFRANTAQGAGGGIHNAQPCSPTLTNVVFSENTAGGGGGMYNEDSANPTLTNCTFNRNTVRYDGGALYVADQSLTTMVNCILWGDKAKNGNEIGSYTASVNITYSDVQGGYSGTGNINANPLFINAIGGNLRLFPASPAVDGGNSSAPGLGGISVDLGGGSRVLGTAVDMGAFEFDSQGWVSVFLPSIFR